MDEMNCLICGDDINEDCFVDFLDPVKDEWVNQLWRSRNGMNRAYFICNEPDCKEVYFEILKEESILSYKHLIEKILRSIQGL